MPSTRTIYVEGLTQAQEMLRGARGEGFRGPVQQALVDGAKMIRSDAEYLAPRGPTGNLKRSLRSAAGRAAKTFLQAFTFSLTKIAPHAHLVERGTKPHSIVPKRAGGVLAFGKHFLKHVEHPGAKAWPFFSMAVSRNRTRVRRKVEAAVKDALEKLNAAAV